MGQAGGGLAPLPDKGGPAVEEGGFASVQQVQPVIKAGPALAFGPFWCLKSSGLCQEAREEREAAEALAQKGC